MHPVEMFLRTIRGFLVSLRAVKVPVHLDTLKVATVGLIPLHIATLALEAMEKSGMISVKDSVATLTERGSSVLAEMESLEGGTEFGSPNPN